MMMFTLADRLGEADPRKIAALPADILLHWQAWLYLTGYLREGVPNEQPRPQPEKNTDQARQCADVMRILGQ